jgi:hypothetical protein
MSTHIGVIREFKTAQFRVVVDAIEEESPDLSWADAETLTKISNGEYVLFCARARVFHKTLGELSADYLGGCVYSSLAAFMDHKECGKQNREYAARGDAGRCGSYFAEMVNTVIGKARKALQAAKTIKVRS